MVESYVQRIRDFPRPRTIKELRSYLGIIGYYRGFYPRFAQVTSGLQAMRNKNELIWTKELQAEFEKSKELFTTSPVRHYPDFSPEGGRFILETDWSKDAKAAVLLQEHESGEERFIGCVAHKCNTAERNYSSNKGEMAAAAMGMQHFEHILSYKKFLLQTDNKFVTHRDGQKETRGIYSRWNELFASFDFVVEHKPGTQNTFADALSRRTDLPPSPDGIEEEEDRVVLDVYMTDVVDEIDGIEKILETELGVELPELKRLCNEDASLSFIMDKLDSGRPVTKEEKQNLDAVTLTYVRKMPQLRLHNGVLYFESLTPMGKVLRLCLPELLINKVFHYAHNSPQAGHPGINHTLDKLQRRYYFPGMAARTTYHVNNCVDCLQKLKTPLKTPRLTA